MTAQIRRAAASVPANIAEGNGREHTGSYIHALRISQGSLKELETHVLLAQTVELMDKADAEQILGASEQVGKLLRSLIRALQDRSHDLLPTPYSLLPMRAGQRQTRERTSMIYKAIVFLPAIGALIAGLLGRVLGARPCEIITTSFVGAARRPLLDRLLAGGHRRRDAARPRAALGDLGRARRVLGAAHRHADRCDAGGRQHGLGARAPLLHRLHARGRQPPALLRLSLHVHLRHAGAGDERQLPAAVLRLGGRGPRLLPADRLLVSEARGQCRRHQGLRRQPGGRFRLRARHLRHLRRVRHHRLRCRVPGGARRGRQAHGVPGPPVGHADRAVPAAVHGRHGQVGAVPPAHLAARRHGGPHPGLGADPCRHHGDGRRVHGGAAVADVRAGAGGAAGRDAGRRRHGLLRRHRGPRAERHQARGRLLDLLAARLHVRRLRGRRLRGRHLPPLHARLLQGAAVPGLGLGDPRHASRAGHAQDGRAGGQDPLHLRHDADRHAVADGRRHSAPRRLCRLPLQGRHHRGLLRRAHAEQLRVLAAGRSPRS